MMPWDIRLSIDLFLGGIGVGTFLLAVVLSNYDRRRYAGLVKAGAVLAPVAMSLGLLFLIWELGRPERFILTMYYINPYSLTTWGVFFQGGFVASSLVYAYMQLRDIDAPLLKLVEVAGVFLALGVGLYHGLVLASVGRPLWAGGISGPLFLFSSLAGGTALLLALKVVSSSAGVPLGTRSEGGREFNFSMVLLVLLVLQLAFVMSWQIVVPRAGLEAAATMDFLFAQYGSIYWLLGILGGLVLPLAALLFHLLLGGGKEMSDGMAVAVSALVIAGSFAFKHVYIAAGQLHIWGWL